MNSSTQLFLQLNSISMFFLDCIQNPFNNDQKKKQQQQKDEFDLDCQNGGAVVVVVVVVEDGRVSPHKSNGNNAIFKGY